MGDERDIQVATQLGAINATIEAMDGRVSAGFARVEAAMARHVEAEAGARRGIYKRLGSLEHFRAWCIGVGAGVSGLFAAFKAWASFVARP